MSEPRIGLALGGGGARGLAHIAMLEAFDELGIRPHHVAGTSMGALVGAPFASGISAREIRDHAESVLANRVLLARRLIRDREASLASLLSVRELGPVMINGMRLVELFLPQAVVERIEMMPIRFSVAATDFYARREAAISKGPVREAVAASIAIPGLISAPRINDRYVIDGGMVNPVPIDHVRRDCEITVAIDVTGGPVAGLRPKPSTADLVFGAMQIIQRQISSLRMKDFPPDILIEPAVDEFRVLDFFKARAIIAASAPAKERLKRRLAHMMEAKEMSFSVVPRRIL